MSELNEFWLTLKEFPPSANDLYFSRPRGGKAMTTKGKRFQRLVVDQIHRESGHKLAEFKADQPYEILILVFFPTIYNKGWPEKAQQRYKKRDADNLLKLLLDTISKAIGVDDANFLKVSVEKHMDPKDPRIEIIIRDF